MTSSVTSSLETKILCSARCEVFYDGRKEKLPDLNESAWYEGYTLFLPILSTLGVIIHARKGTHGGVAISSSKHVYDTNNKRWKCHDKVSSLQWAIPGPVSQCGANVSEALFPDCPADVTVYNATWIWSRRYDSPDQPKTAYCRLSILGNSQGQYREIAILSVAIVVAIIQLIIVIFSIHMKKTQPPKPYVLAGVGPSKFEPPQGVLSKSQLPTGQHYTLFRNDTIKIKIILKIFK
ncbi:hypothetical protein HELRODRAFT_176846 [Helobdella robusta]|uniref:Uncharacterized protein n=1 Tax=Helobdella robusta TaxID=6412 RepID=T1FAY8_HELRO|nr:hypothetical protein HELRODRAFT_176846 [Helobdella robusta]ESN98386.1 hypothetical protein HELRODRAFT_176846 [Helobdella robusta]